MSAACDSTSDEEATMTLGQRMQTLRINAGLSLSDMARHSGVSRSFFYQLERDQSSPTLRIVDQIAGVFAMTTLELLQPVYGTPLVMQEPAFPLGADLCARVPR